MPSPTTAGPQLEIVFRYLMLYYSSPEGLKVLVPSDQHRAVLRDLATDSVFRLSQASVRLEGAGTSAAPTTVRPNGLLVPLERPLQQPRVVPLARFLTRTPVDPSLCALVELPGGTLDGYPSEAFPERASQPVKFKFGPVNVFEALVTDTTLFRGPITGKTDLVIETPRRSIRIDVTAGGRFELRNEDDKIGPIIDEVTYHSDEASAILRLVVDAQAAIQCDTYSCAGFTCGV